MFLIIIDNNIMLGFHPHDLFFVTLKKGCYSNHFLGKKLNHFTLLEIMKNNMDLL